MGAGSVTLHYHGTPITPQDRLYELAGRNFCVSFAAALQIEKVHRIGQSVMIDNGAFTSWKQAKTTARKLWWEDFYNWVEPWLDYRTTWAVIPDVIDGTEEENDRLMEEWPHGLRGAPVWHMHESIHRLKMLCAEWPRVCIGSSGEYRIVGDDKWHHRMDEAMNEVCGNGPASTWFHMLRGMSVVDAGYPFASVDSTDVAQNHNRPQNTVKQMADRWDARNAPARWTVKSLQEELFA